VTNGRGESLSHVDEGGTARMVDVGDKPITARRAVAGCRVRVRPETLALVRDAAAAKGDVLGVARIAGIMAAKRTADLIPLCHPLPVSHLSVDFQLIDDPPSILVRADARTEGRTGVEMEAMTAAGVAALTVYDMCKAVDRAIVIDDLKLIHKSGGKSGTYDAE